MSNAAEDLRSVLSRVDRKNDLAWQGSLISRKIEERIFHDLRVDRQLESSTPPSGKETANKKYYRFTNRSQEYLDTWILRNAPGKVLLDYACGDGESTLKAARAGAALAIGIDISAVSIEKAIHSAKSEGLTNTIFIEGDCEATGIPDNSVDLILCCGMLHHLDLSYALPEMRRILRPQGRVLAYEALDYNPAIKAYRFLTPNLRTNWEKHHIISLSDLKFAKRFFDIGEVRYWNITSILSPHLPMWASTFAKLDSLLTRLPIVRLLSWIITFELVKRVEK